MWAKRFPLPEFHHEELKDMQWVPPTYLSESEINKLIDGQKAGDPSIYGCYPVQASDEFYGKLNVRGDNKHAVMCVMPDKDVRVLGRSHAWKVQRAFVLDSLDPESFNAELLWKTGRPMATRLGPWDGTTIKGGVLYVVCCHAIKDYFVGNRTILQKQWQESSSGHGFAVLSSSEEDLNDFHDCNLYFEWSE
ncbi:MAG: hypothetical protein ACE5K1_07485 [Acidiferrobacterales bacterium]